MAEIHPQLRRDCLLLGHFELSHLLLMRDASYPWFILVPDRADITEIYQLGMSDQEQLVRESSYLSRTLAERFQADKLNIAALGNVVAQLHIHHIVRYRDDPAWPTPVWGRVAPRPYTQDRLDEVIAELRAGLTRNFAFAV